MPERKTLLNFITIGLAVAALIFAIISLSNISLFKENIDITSNLAILTMFLIISTIINP